MFEEIAVAVRHGLLDQAIQVGRDVSNRLNESRDINNAHVKINNILNEFDIEKQRLLNLIEDTKRNIGERNISLEAENKKLKRQRDELNVASQDNYKLYHNEYYAHLKTIDNNEKAILSLQEENKKNLFEKEKEMRKIQMADMYEHNELKDDLFYTNASSVSDNAVKNFLRKLLKSGKTVENLEALEINIFSLAYEKFIKDNNMDISEEWRNRLADAIDSRYNDNK